MSFKERLLIALPIILSAVLLLNNSSGPSGDNTGSPNDNLQNACTQCHSSFTINSGSGGITTNAPSTYVPGATYTISVSIAQPSPIPGRYGFQAVFLNSSNGQSGSLSATGGVQVSTAGSIQHVKHNSTFNSTGTFTFNWTAPATIGTTTMYFAGIAANNNGNTSGDYVYKNSATIIGVVPFTYTSTSSNCSCNASCDGAAAVSVTTPGTYTYLWSNGSTMSNISGLCAGSYTVTITNSSGISLSESFTITQPTAISSSASIVGSSCAVASGSISLSASGGLGGYSYNWNNGLIGATQAGLPAGTYTITIADQSGCQMITTEVVPQIGSGLSATFTTQDELCNQQNGGALINMNNGLAPFDYNWSNGSMSDSLLDVTAGNYQVTVTDANGCTETFSVSIGAAGAPEIAQIDITGNACFGDNSGSINVSVINGQPPYMFTWSLNANSDSAQADALANGTYFFTVTDNLGCSDFDSVVITSPEQIAASYEIMNDWSESTSQGSISLEVTGGVSPYTYLWDDTLSQTTPEAIQLEGNRYYSVQITDANECQLILDSLFVDMNLGTKLEPTSTGFSVYPNPSHDWIFINTNDIIRKIQVFDLRGKLWLELHKEVKKLNVAKLPSGVYLLRIETQESEETVRITVE